MRIGVLGGTFNPPHKGHVRAAITARERLGLDEVLFIPSARPPHKPLPESTPTDAMRLEMTRLAAAEAGARVSDIELLRGGLSYTADTLKELKREFKGGELWLIVGADMFCTLHEWHKPEEVLRLANVAAVPRKVADMERLFKAKAFLEGKYDCVLEVLDTPVMDISSSELRADIEGGARALPEMVYRFIIENSLYGAARSGEDGETFKGRADKAW